MTWDDRIDRARNRKLLGLIPWRRFNGDDRAAADEWFTCAAGDVAARYGVFVSTREEADGTYATDEMLDGLGMRFTEAVSANHVDLAGDLLDRIAMRVRALVEPGYLQRLAREVNAPASRGSVEA